MSQPYIIQLGFNAEDDRLWWLDEFKWDIKDEPPEYYAQRPTEVGAIVGLYRQSRLIRKRGVHINLSPWHIEALQWDYCRREYPHYAGKEYQWVSEQMGVPQLQVKALLDECSLAILMRDLLHMKPLDIDWNGGVLVKRTRKTA